MTMPQPPKQWTTESHCGLFHQGVHEVVKASPTTATQQNGKKNKD